MIPVIGQVLPLSVALAMSSVPIVTVLTLLLRSRTRLAGAVFSVGSVAGLVVLVAVFSLALPATPGTSGSAGQDPHAWIEGVVGVAALVLGIVTGLRRGSGSSRIGAGLRRATGALAGVRPPLAFALGFAIDLRPKSLLLCAATGLVIAPAGLSVGESAVAVGTAALLGSSSVTVPVTIALVRRDGARSWLEGAERWITRNGTTVTVVVLVLIGVVLLGDALRGA